MDNTVIDQHLMNFYMVLGFCIFFNLSTFVSVLYFGFKTIWWARGIDVQVEEHRKSDDEKHEDFDKRLLRLEEKKCSL